MNEDKLVDLESWLRFFMFIGIVYIILSFYLMFLGLGRTTLFVNDKNREEIENMLKISEDYNDSIDIKDLDKIQFFLAFDDYEFTLFYKNGEEERILDDDLNDLKEYIENKGYNESWKYIFIDVLVIFLLIQLNIKRKDIRDKIDYIDKEI